MDYMNQYKNALEANRKKLAKKKSPRGMEGILQRAIQDKLKGCSVEVPLKDLGIMQIDGTTNGRVDLVHYSHGIEAKVMRLPRLNARPSNALYDIGQISSDYWRLSHSLKLETADVLILLYGPLILDLKTPTYIYREFHNRMYVDFHTSLEFGELKTEGNLDKRKRQIMAAKAMRFDRPANEEKCHRTIVVEEFALIQINVEMRTT